MKTFGELIKELRISKEITLRDFCKNIKTDPSNWSKIERGINPPPKSKEVLEEIGKILNINTSSEEYKSLCDLAALAHIPNELISDTELLEMLPAFFRTSRGDKPLKGELDKLIKIIKEE